MISNLFSFEPTRTNIPSYGFFIDMEILGSLRATAEYVLLDTPPVVPVTDAAVLAPRVDGVLLVLKAGKTKREMAQRAKTLLEKVNARLLGVVLNNAQLDAGIKSYYADQGGRRS